MAGQVDGGHLRVGDGHAAGIISGNSSTQPGKQNYDEPLKHEAHSSPGVRLAHRVCGIGRVAAGWRRALLEAEKLRAIGRVSSRLLGTFLSDTWSYYFDAVVVIRQEVAPTFDPW